MSGGTNHQSLEASAGITGLLLDVRNGNRGAQDRLYSRIYNELRRIARCQLSRYKESPTLGATDLVHEAYLKLIGETQRVWQDREHFFAVAATAIRHILIDRARERATKKRGGEWQRVSLNEERLSADDAAELLLALDQALNQLSALNERLTRVVEYRFFGGLTEAEIGKLLGLNERTVRRDWRTAKAFLAAKLGKTPTDPEGGTA